MDHSKFAVQHAQHIANLIVDEARLSANMFEWTNDEQTALLSNFDVASVSLPTPVFEDSLLLGDEKQFYRAEMYLF